MATGTMPTKGITKRSSMRNTSNQAKLDAIRRVHEGESKASVARDIGVPESTLRGWCKNESKISYMSRQSSPDTDESLEPKEKRLKIEEPMQPFNLSLKSAPIYTPNSESLYTPMDFSKSDIDCTPKTPQNLSIKTETPKSTASQERNAELTQMRYQFGLNKKETFNNVNLTNLDLQTQLAILTMWNQQFKTQVQKNIQPSLTSPGSSRLKQQQQQPQTVKPPKEQQSTEEYVNGWLRAHETLGHRSSNGLATTSSASTSNPSSSFFSQWIQQLYSNVPTVVPSPEKPILYQQLTKDSDPENLSSDKSSNKVKAVLDNVLNNNNSSSNNNNNVSEDQSYCDALEHGEKFLHFLESCGNPSVTATQIMQFRALLNNLKNGQDRRNGDLQNKTKVKRK